MSIDEHFSAFVYEQRSSLFTTAFLLTGDVGEAEELLQEVLSRLYPKWSRVLAATAPRAYVRRSLVNHFVGSRRRLAPVPASGAGSDLGRDDDALDQVLDRAVVAELLVVLTPRQRAAIVLRFFHDQTDSEIGAALGCRAVTVRSLVSRGLVAMRAQLAQLDEQPAVDVQEATS